MSTEETDNSGAIVDISGNELKKQQNYAIQMANRKQSMVELIMRQTDYTKEITIQRLAKWKNNYLYVIKEYMNPNFQDKEEEESSTKNQMIYGEIRHFMDDVNRQQLYRKRQKEQYEQKKAAYLAYMKSKTN